jgi:SanA protein
MLVAASDRIHGRSTTAPESSTAIVLGTSPGSKDAPNVFFTNRMDAAAAVWKAGKVRRIIVSGDNRRKDYDEPTSMLKALVARGVPADVVVRDYAGLRTLDTMFRAAHVFNVKDAIIVTDDWHLPRALFLADQAGIRSCGVASSPVPWSQSPMTRIREYLSRVKALLDVYVLDTKPRFGE